MANTGKWSVIIAEDEEPIREEICSILSAHKKFKIVKEVGNGADLKKILLREKFDLAILDIELPVKRSTEVLSEIIQYPPSIFITAYDEFTSNAFKLGAIDYIVKPFTKERVALAMKRAEKHLLNRSEAGLKQRGVPVFWLYDDTGGLVPVASNAIHYLKADNKNSWVFTKSERFRITKPLKSILSKLDPDKFIQAHRTFAVNLEQVSRLNCLKENTYEIILKDSDTHIPVSRRYLQKIRSNKI